jgi:hypothetical protein
VHSQPYVNRRIAYVIAALVLPGGFVALFGAWLFRAASRTVRGRKFLSLARERVPFGRRLPVLAPAFVRVQQAA